MVKNLLALLNNPVRLFIATYIVVMIWAGINFPYPQNDDWVYRQNTEWFLRGNLLLDSYITPTFYLQGIMGAIFILVSGWNVSLLTAILSITNVGMFCALITRVSNLHPSIRMMMAVLYATNPLNIYLSLGYMTEQYFMFFLLLSCLIFEHHRRTNTDRSLLVLIVVSFLGLLVRQIALIIPISYGAYMLLHKKYHHAAIGLLWFLNFYLFLEYVFPQTAKMKQIPLQFGNILNFPYASSLVIGIGIILAATLLPLFVVGLFRPMTTKDRIIYATLTLGTALVIYKVFSPSMTTYGEFPYFQNTWERTGFYPKGLHGTKYTLPGWYDLYRVWEWIGVFGLASAIVLTVKSIAENLKHLTIYHIMIIAYLGVLIITETFYDRYIIVLVPLALLTLAHLATKLQINNEATHPKAYNLSREGKFFIIAGGIFTLAMTLYSYQFGMDFALANNYVWQKSEEIVTQTSIDPKYIHGTNAWKLSYRNVERNYLYTFSYDSPEVNGRLKDKHDLIEVYDVRYPGNIFINPKIYLYKLK